MNHFLNLDTWKRKAQFDFFRNYRQPFFNICANADVSSLLRWTKEQGRSFFKSSLYLSVKAANEVEEFRYRIRGKRVVVYEKIHAGSTVLNEDETFSYCYFDFLEPYASFEKHVGDILEAHARNMHHLDPRDDRDDLVHYSIIPWISFTSFKHARKTGHEDCIPKIVFGKYFEERGKYQMPVSVEVHHALMDGIHVGKYFETFQTYLNSAKDILQE